MRGLGSCTLHTPSRSRRALIAVVGAVTCSACRLGSRRDHGSVDRIGQERRRDSFSLRGGRRHTAGVGLRLRSCRSSLVPCICRNRVSAEFAVADRDAGTRTAAGMGAVRVDPGRGCGLESAELRKRVRTTKAARKRQLVPQLSGNQLFVCSTKQSHGA